MECVFGTRFSNFGAVAEFTGCRMKRRTPSRRVGAFSFCRWRVVCEVKVKGESCVAVKKGFADEEDYVKAGGSEIYFVQMQQNKSMERQSRIADKVGFVSFFCLPISSEVPGDIGIMSGLSMEERAAYCHELNVLARRIVCACYNTRFS